ncbi:MAG: hypothetical protein GEV06_00980 [Luteitalea sp.]|nr:hypothetical protein [Luteitalea sp.]
MPQLELKTISGDQVHEARTWRAEAFAGIEQEEFHFVDEVQLDFDVHKAADEYRLVGRLVTNLDVPCSRCLELFRFHVEMPFDVLYLPQNRNRGDGEREIDEEELGVAFHQGDAIDLGQLVREQSYLALPMKPLCEEACHGLCPQCGTNLNVTVCSCEPVWTDPRLEPLKQLRSDQ